MSIFKKTQNFCKNAHWYDISIIKGAVFFFTLFLITSWQGFRELVLSVEWYWYLIIAILFTIPIAKKMNSK